MISGMHVERLLLAHKQYFGRMLQGFQRMDAAANMGRQNGRIRTDMLLEALRGLGVAIPTQIGAALMEIADDDKNG